MTSTSQTTGRTEEMRRVRNHNNNRTRHEGVDDEDGSMINTAKHLHHTELRELTMAMTMMVVMAIKMNRDGCVRRRGTASPL